MAGVGLQEIADVLAPLPGSCHPHGTKQRTNPEVSAEDHFGAKAARVLWNCRSSHCGKGQGEAQQVVNTADDDDDSQHFAFEKISLLYLSGHRETELDFSC